jgi:hypothetical protein
MLMKSFVLSYHVALRSEYSVVLSVTIAAWKRCSDCLTPSCLKGWSCLIYVICVCLKTVVSNTYFVVFCFRLVYHMLPVSLDYPFLIAPSVFSKVYVRQFAFTLKERACQASSKEYSMNGQCNGEKCVLLFPHIQLLHWDKFLYLVSHREVHRERRFNAAVLTITV